MIDSKTLKHWREVALASSDNLTTGIFRSDEVEDQIAQFRESIALIEPKSEHMWVVASTDPKTPDAPITEKALYAAITGNGPTSEANARFFAGARVALLEAIDEIERLQYVIARRNGMPASGRKA